MVTIHNLEVRLEVEGDGDEAVFARLFQKYIRLWCREAERIKQQSRRAASDRSLGDQPASGSGGDPSW
jgi:hypothetical protein